MNIRPVRFPLEALRESPALAAPADFRATVNNFVRAYDFLSQIINYESVDIEK